MENILKEFEVLQQNLDNLPIENLADYDLSKTALFIVDINLPKKVLYILIG